MGGATHMCEQRGAVLSFREPGTCSRQGPGLEMRQRGLQSSGERAAACHGKCALNGTRRILVSIVLALLSVLGAAYELRGDLLVLK